MHTSYYSFAKRGNFGIHRHNFYVAGNETKIGQHFTFSDELQIFESQRNLIWEGKNC